MKGAVQQCSSAAAEAEAEAARQSSRRVPRIFTYSASSCISAGKGLCLLLLLLLILSVRVSVGVCPPARTAARLSPLFLAATAAAKRTAR